MTIRKMTSAEIDACDTYGIPRGEVDAAFTDDAGGLALLWRDHIGPVESGKLPNFQVFEFLHLRIVVDGLTTSVGPHEPGLKTGLAALLERLHATNTGLRGLSVEYALTSNANRLVIESHQVVKGRRRDARFGISSELMAEVLPAVCELMFDAVRQEVLQARQKHVEREAKRILNQIASNLWGKAARAVNYQARHDALREERRGAYVAARLDLALRAREELAAEIDDPEVREAVIAGVADLGQPTTLILND